MGIAGEDTGGLEHTQARAAVGIAGAGTARIDDKAPERPLICAGQVRRRGPAPGELQSPVANLLTGLGYGTIASLFASY